MKKIKSICCLLLAIAMVLTVAACGGSGDTDTTSSGTGSEQGEEIPATRPAANTQSLSAPKYEVTDKVYMNLHIPARRRLTHTIPKHLIRIFIYICCNKINTECNNGIKHQI